MTMSPSAPEVQALFDRIAPVYDDLNQQLSLGLHHVWKTMTVQWVDPQPGHQALDICCGSGDIALLLARAVGKAGAVTGIDFSTEQLAIASQRSQTRYPEHHLTWQWGDALELPLPDDQFDCATMGYGLRNVVDIPQALQELHRVLKFGAKAAILDFHRPTQPLVQELQAWYLERVVVPTAKQFNLTADYAYISPSVDRFPQGMQQEELARKAGFTTAVHYPLLGGMMGVLVVQKS